MRVVGDFNTSEALVKLPQLVASEIGGGNDSISVTNTTAVSKVGMFQGSSFVDVQGDFNSSTNFVSFAGTSSKIGGGNDSITVTNVDVSSEGSAVSAEGAFIAVTGDGNHSVADLPPTTAAIGGGNDSISIDAVAVASRGGAADQTFIHVVGDTNKESFAGSKEVTARIGGANDTISLTNTTIASEGNQSRFFEQSEVVIVGDVGARQSAATPVDEGDDEVVLRHVQVVGQFSDVRVDTATGDDLLDVQNCSFNTFSAFLQDGNDFSKFLANTFVNADLDGGSGYDRLSAHNTWAS